MPEYVSAEAKDLLAGMLHLDPSQRIMLPQVCCHGQSHEMSQQMVMQLSMQEVHLI